jgi:D-alanyl-D-alanine carboxypeptidase
MLAIGLISTLLAAASCTDEEPSSDAKSTSSTSSPSPAPESSAPAASLDEVAQRLGGILQSEIQGADPGGAIVLVRIGEDERVVAAGLANVRPRTPLSPTSRFPIASVTKPMVATAVLRLINQGKLQLDDSLQQWLPGLVSDGDRITIAHLLSHQSRLPELLSDPKPPATLEATIRATA